MVMLPSRQLGIRSRAPDIKVSFFSQDDLNTIFSYVSERIRSDSRRSNNHIRYQLMLTTLLRTGARISECLMLRPVDVNFQTDTITLVTLKKNQAQKDDIKPYAAKKLPRRTLPLHPELKSAMMSYFLEMHVDTRSADPIFPVTRVTVDNYLTRIEKATGIKTNAHKFRHTFAVKALMDGVPINVLQKWLAHSSLLVTSVYADVLSMDTSAFMKQVS
jgi:integrase